MVGAGGCFGQEPGSLSQARRSPGEARRGMERRGAGWAWPIRGMEPRSAGARAGEGHRGPGLAWALSGPADGVGRGFLWFGPNYFFSLVIFLINKISCS